MFAAEIQYMLDATRDVRTAIDQITEKDERVRGLARQHLKQPVKLCAAAVNVANDEGFHNRRGLLPLLVH